jgi:glucose/arabinose dehydrogenase
MIRLTLRVLAPAVSTARVLALVLATVAAQAADRAPPRCDEDNGGLTLPPGFCAVVAAEGVGRARDVTVAPNGNVYVAIDGDDGGITALRDADGDGRLEQVERFGNGAASEVQYKNDHLYFASDLFILRYPLLGGTLVPRARPEIILTGLLPERSRRFEVDDDGNLYVGTDAPESCREDERAADAAGEGACTPSVRRFSADTPNQDASAPGKRYSTGSGEGIVNARSTGRGKIYAVHGAGAGSSGVGAGHVSDLLTYTGTLFPAHYRGGTFVASAAESGQRLDGRRHRVDFVPVADGGTAGEPEPFAEGFVAAPGVRRTPEDPRDRPIGLAQGPDGSLYISDAEYGRIWRVLYAR